MHDYHISVGLGVYTPLLLFLFGGIGGELSSSLHVA